MKTLKFAENLVPLVLSGEKTRTWRFFDEKNLQIGDDLEFINYDTMAKFAMASIIDVKEKPFGEIIDEDLEGHEKFENFEEMLKTYQRYYGERVNVETTVRIIDFKLIKKNAMKKLLTLCVVHQGDRVLLGMKKRGFGAGRWNGFGGKLEKGETIEEAARREVFEEACIDVTDLQKVGIVEFEWQGNPEIMEVHIFRATQFVGEPTEGEEMKPQWFAVNEIPLDDMWPDNKYWIPMFLEGKKFTGKFLFGKGDSVLEYTLDEKESVE